MHFLQFFNIYMTICKCVKNISKCINKIWYLQCSKTKSIQNFKAKICTLFRMQNVSKSILENCFYLIFNRSDCAKFTYLPTESDKLFVQHLLVLPCVHLNSLRHLTLCTRVSTGEKVPQRAVKILLVYCLLQDSNS